MIRKSLLLLCLTCFLWVPKVPAQNPEPPRSLVSPPQNLEPPRSLVSPLYLIQPNDVLAIFVWKEPNLSMKVTVRPDGRISFPLVQDMQAAGMNPEQLKTKIES